MAETKKIKTALVSVFHKDGLDELLAKLNEEGVKFLSTGCTQKFIESLGYECQKVEDVTTYPSILGGRVKTLHPKIFGGILARRDNEGDQEQMKEFEIPSIDLVIVDLYPFEQTVAIGASDADIIKKYVVLSLAWNDDYILEVLCTCTDQRNTTNINLLDNINIAGTTGYSLLEWIQIYDNEVDAWNFKFLHLLLVTLIVAASQD